MTEKPEQLKNDLAGKKYRLRNHRLYTALVESRSKFAELEKRNSSELEQLKSIVRDLERQLSAAEFRESRLRDEQLETLDKMERWCEAALEVCRDVEEEKQRSENLRRQLLQTQQETSIKISLCE